jgi:hypothetical protein
MAATRELRVAILAHATRLIDWCANALGRLGRALRDAIGRR